MTVFPRAKTTKLKSTEYTEEKNVESSLTKSIQVFNYTLDGKVLKVLNWYQIRESNAPRAKKKFKNILRHIKQSCRVPNLKELSEKF